MYYGQCDPVTEIFSSSLVLEAGRLLVAIIWYIRETPIGGGSNSGFSLNLTQGPPTFFSRYYSRSDLAIRPQCRSIENKHQCSYGSCSEHSVYEMSGKDSYHCFIYDEMSNRNCTSTRSLIHSSSSKSWNCGQVIKHRKACSKFHGARPE